MPRSSLRLALLALTPLLAATPVAAQQRGAQQPIAPTGPITLLQAITLGRSQGVNAAIAQLNVGTADARVGQRRADLLPNISGSAAYTRQTVNLEEFGFPGITGVTDPFNVYRLQLRASQTIFDASLIGRLRAARDTAVAAGWMPRPRARSPGRRRGWPTSAR